MTAETSAPLIDHHKACTQPAPIPRLSWKQTPELVCPCCGRSVSVNISESAS